MLLLNSFIAILSRNCVGKTVEKKTKKQTLMFLIININNYNIG